VVDLAFQDRFEVRLHFAAGDFHPNSQRKLEGEFCRIGGVDIRTDNFDFTVAD